MMKSITIFLMTATGAALYTGPGAGELLAAPLEAPASSEPEKAGNASAALAVSRRDRCGDHNGDGEYDENTVNAGRDCALAAKDFSDEPEDEDKRCCCYKVRDYPLEYLDEVKCYVYSGRSIKAALADSKLKYEHKKSDNNPKAPVNERKGFAAIRELVEDKNWCPDIEQPAGVYQKWCPDWHSGSWSAYQRHPIQATKKRCEDTRSKQKNTDHCIKQVHPADKKKFTAKELVAKVDRHYEEEAMCCCYRYSGLTGDSETCYHMYHEDIVYVQDRLGLFKDKKKKEKKEEDGVDEDEDEREELGLEHEDEPEEPKKGEEQHQKRYKCPKAYWKTSWEITTNGVVEVIQAPFEYFGIMKQDHNAAANSYICPTKGQTTKLRTCWERIKYSIGGAVLSYSPSHEEVLEPSNAVRGRWLGNPCKSEKTEQWQPRLCY